MARYGRDYGQDRTGGQGGYGGGRPGAPNRGGGESGGMGSDAQTGAGQNQARGGYTGFGTGGGAYDNDYNSGAGNTYGGQSYGGLGRGGPGTGQGGYGGYGADTGFGGAGGGGGYGGSESSWGGGRDTHRGGYGYAGGGNFGGGQGYSGGGQNAYGGYGYADRGGAGYGGGQNQGGGGQQNYGGYGGGWASGGGGGGYGGGYGGGQSYGGGQTYGGGQSNAGGQQGGDEVRRLRAADVMTDNPESVTPDTTLMAAAQKMRDLDVGIIPVVESDSSKRLRGVLTDRDITIRAVAEAMDANTTTVRDVMTTQVETCNKNDSLRDVLSVMEREQVRRVPITDREGRLVGIIAQADVATELDSPTGQRQVADTLESISEPGNPRRGGWGGRPSQGRGGLMGAVRNAVSSLGGQQGGSQQGGADEARSSEGGENS